MWALSRDVATLPGGAGQGRRQARGDGCRAPGPGLPPDAGQGRRQAREVPFTGELPVSPPKAGLIS
jgi:hypothetical protein